MNEDQINAIADAILELLQTIPNPDKADLVVAISRTLPYSPNTVVSSEPTQIYETDFGEFALKLAGSKGSETKEY